MCYVREVFNWPEYEVRSMLSCSTSNHYINFLPQNYIHVINKSHGISSKCLGICFEFEVYYFDHKTLPHVLLQIL